MFTGIKRCLKENIYFTLVFIVTLLFISPFVYHYHSDKKEIAKCITSINNETTPVVFQLTGSSTDVEVIEYALNKGYHISDSVKNAKNSSITLPAFSGNVTSTVIVPCTINSEIIIFVK